MALSFLTTRAATFSLLLGFPLVHAFACSSPSRDFMEGGSGGGEQGGEGARTGGTKSTGGSKAGEQGGQSNTGNGGDGAEGNETASGGEIGEPEGGAGGEVNQGGAPSTGGDGNTGGRENTGGAQGSSGQSSTGGAQGTGGAEGTGGVTNTGGAPSTGGAPNTGGAPTGGTKSTGGVPSTGGTKSTGGAPSTGGTKSTGGAAGSGGTGGPCIPAGAEVCGDGKDNDCNGKVDCPILTGTFPDLHGAAAGKDVQINVATPALSGYTFQCRSARGPAVPDANAWVACPTGANTRIIPRTTAESQNPANDGLWTTHVRILFPGGVPSDFRPFTYYMHSSMHTAPRCTPRATDAAFFEAGDDVVLRSGAFGNQTVLRSPFIQLGFTPTANSSFKVGSADGMTKLMTLRRRFVRSSDDELILMTRNYASTRSGSCDAMDLRTHVLSLLPLHSINKSRFFEDDCEAIVFNKLGAGVCLYVDSGGVVQRRTTHTYLGGTGYSRGADNFFWRKLLDNRWSSDGYIHFMPKCTTALCNNGVPNMIFLPDRGQFPYF